MTDKKFNTRTVLMSDWYVRDGEYPSRVVLKRYEGERGRVYYSTMVEAINPHDYKLSSFMEIDNMDAHAAMADYYKRLADHTRSRYGWQPDPFSV